MDLTGKTFAGLEVVSRCGSGGMGTVWKARQPLLNRFVAIKVMARDLAEDADFVARFKREAATAAQLHHQNMVLVHSAGEENGHYYIVMEFVEGRSLHEHIARHGHLTPHEALAVTIHVAQALQYAWDKSKLIHRDIKPANIFLSSAGEVKVGDLGLAKNVGQSTAGLTQTGMAMGSPHYIAPEQARGLREIDFRADIYSLGCTLFHMLTGQPPYDGSDSMSIMVKHINEPPPAIFKALPGCPVPLGMLVGKMLAKQPNDRHQSYGELIADLYAVTEKLEAAAAQPTALPSQPAAAPAKAQAQPRAATPTPTMPLSGKKKSPAMIYGIAGAVAVVLVGGLLLWSPWKNVGGASAPRPSITTQQSRGAEAPPTFKPPPANPKPGDTMVTSAGIELVYIPPGEFMLGSTKEEQEWAVANGAKEEYVKREGEAPRKAAIKQGFWMGRTEVTVGQWKEFVTATGYQSDAEKKGYVDSAPRKGQPWGRVDGLSWRDPGFGAAPRDDHPVCCVSWNDAVAFCEWLTERERKAGRLASSQVVRLPTEAEWEYACRAGTQTKWWWGDTKEDGEGRLNWSGTADGFGFTSPVDAYGERGRNKFGLADMLGNVYEWCLDEYDGKQAHEECYKGNPGGRVLRGGSFNYAPAYARAAYRNGDDPSFSSGSSGFRVGAGAVP